MQHRGGPRLLATDRSSVLYLERARVHVEMGRVVYHVVDDERRREFNIPHVNLSVLFLGQGTSITQDAFRLLGEEGVHLAVTGSGGSPLHMGALTTYVGTRHFREILPIYLSEERSLEAARSIMRDRIENVRTIARKLSQRHLRSNIPETLEMVNSNFEERIARCSSISEMLGFEGSYSKGLYQSFSRSSNVGPDFRRDAGSSNADRTRETSRSNKIANRLIDHGNYLCYGVAGAALWALGIPPHLSLFHGKTRAGGLVFDVADGFKDAFVLPIAFAVASGELEEDDDAERSFRGKLITAFDDHCALAIAIEIVNHAIERATPAGTIESA